MFAVLYDWEELRGEGKNMLEMKLSIIHCRYNISLQRIGYVLQNSQHGGTVKVECSEGTHPLKSAV